MIHILATVRVKPGALPRYFEILKDNLAPVRGEAGCVSYAPAVDADAGLPAQARDANAVTIVERWETLDALHAHLRAPPMAVYREKVKDLVEGVTLKALEEVA
jgi:quinol monooxygenase YgiN